MGMKHSLLQEAKKLDETIRHLVWVLKELEEENLELAELEGLIPKVTIDKVRLTIKEALEVELAELEAKFKDL